MDEQHHVSQRERAARVIRATVERGCSEEEANEAVSKACALMTAFALSTEDVQEIESDVYNVSKKEFGAVRRPHELAMCLGSPIESLCHVRFWVDKRYCFFGAEHDVKVAQWVLDSCINWGDAEWGKIIAARGYSISDGNRVWVGRHRKHRTQFYQGMAARITERINDLIREREEALKARTPCGMTGAAVFVVKQKILDAKFNHYTEKVGLNLKLKRRKMRVGASFFAGRDAGERVRGTRIPPLALDRFYVSPRCFDFTAINGAARDAPATGAADATSY